MRFVWIGIIVVTGTPLAGVILFANPVVVLVLGIDRWRQQVVQPLVPHRWRLLFLIVVCAFASAVYLVHYG